MGCVPELHVRHVADGLIVSQATWWSASEYTMRRPCRSPTTSPLARRNPSWRETADCSMPTACTSSETE